jgi:hypothetical protein
MGWFFINIFLPMTLPLIFLLLVKLVDLPPPYAARAKLIRAVQDGQLGWVAMGFAASSTYELLEYMMGGKKGAPEWSGLVFAVAIGFLALSGLLSMLGTLYPVNDTLPAPATLGAWTVRYRLFVGTLLATLITAALFGLVHYTLPKT